MKTQSIVFLLLLSLGSAWLWAEGAEDEFVEKSEKVNGAVATEHAKLAEWCFKRGLNQTGHEEAKKALELAPENDDAMEALGYKKKRVDGERRWVLDERRAPPKEDAEGAAEKYQAEFQLRRIERYEAIAREYVDLGQYAERLDLPSFARASYEVAVRYDPSNESALKGAGWKKDSLGVWISPGEAAERVTTAEALDDAPDAEVVAELPDWTARVFPEDKLHGVKVGKVTVLGATPLTSDAALYAHAASTLSVDLMGGALADLRVVLTADATEHKEYVSTRHPGIPGLVDDAWIVGEKEVEVLLAEDEELTLERVVYAVTIFEVRRICGESRHPWFEIGMANNMTRRLNNGVQVTGFSGEASGPSEPGRWKRTFRMQVAEERQASLETALVQRDPDENDVIATHFFVRYLTQVRKSSLPDLCRALKASETVDVSFKSACDQTVPELEAEMLDWFRRN